MASDRAHKMRGIAVVDFEFETMSKDTFMVIEEFETMIADFAKKYETAGVIQQQTEIAPRRGAKTADIKNMKFRNS